MVSNDKSPEQGNGVLRSGDRVEVVNAPPWCRSHMVGRYGQVAKVWPFAQDGVMWVRFDEPVAPWCTGMSQVEEFPFEAGQLQRVH